MTDYSKIVIATANLHKLKEIRQILSGLPVQLLSLQDYPEIPPIIEGGETFQENAWIKAKTVFHHTGLLSLADDSGLEVYALNGSPGVYSARFAGSEKNDLKNNKKLLNLLNEVPGNSRTAQFRCVVSIIGPDTEEFVEGFVRGKIADSPKGTAGFGYDPLFIPEGYHQTFAELGADIKNRMSHRALAFQAARKIIEKYILQPPI